MHAPVWHRHAWANLLQTAVLMLVLLSISGLAGSLLLGETGLWLALAASAVALLFEPAAVSHLTLHLYRARPKDLAENNFPGLCLRTKVICWIMGL